MIINVVNGIGNAISAMLGEQEEKYRIYLDDTTQGFQAPCFFINVLRTNVRRQLDTLYKYSHTTEVVFYPTSEDVYTEEIVDISEMLYEALEVIDIGDGKVRASSMNANIVENELHFMVEYKFVINKPVTKPKMLHVDTDEQVKTHRR